MNTSGGITLDTPTSTIEIVLAGAVATNQLDATAFYHDLISRSKEDAGEYQSGKSCKATNNTTAVVLVAAPGLLGIARVLDYLSVYNRDTANATVTVRLVDTALTPTTYILVSKLLTFGPGQTLAYSRGMGWQVF